MTLESPTKRTVAPATEKVESVTAADADATSVSAAAAPEPVFFSIVHEFVEGKAGAFFDMISSMSPDDWAAMTAKNHKLGFHNHSFIPSSMDGPVHCLWEAKDQTTLEEFKAFVDGPDGPAPGFFQNTVRRVMPGAILPTSFFHEEAAKPAEQSTGSFFWVYHEFQEGAAAGFWEWISSMSPEAMAQMQDKNRSLGFENHSFQPLDPEGPCICIWESKEPLDIDAFQAFIDSEDGPGAGKVFHNKVYKAMPGAVLPSARFPAPATE